jgi:hypothetical protein
MTYEKNSHNIQFQRMKVVKDFSSLKLPAVNSPNNAVYLYSENEVRSGIHFCSGKAINIIYSEYVSVLAPLIRHINRMCSPSLACPALLHFPHYLITSTILGEKSFNVNCVLILPETFDTFLILRRRTETWSANWNLIVKSEL